MDPWLDRGWENCNDQAYPYVISNDVDEKVAKAAWEMIILANHAERDRPDAAKLVRSARYGLKVTFFLGGRGD